MSLDREHGTPRGYRQHRKVKDEACAECREAWRIYCQTYRPPRPRVVQPCGTEAAYRRHLRHDEQPCDECTSAAVAADANRRASRES